YEKYYHIKRSDRKKCINVKKSVQDEFKSITGSTLSKLIKDQVNMLAKEIEKLENEYFTKNAYKQYGFFINRVIQILFPQFIQKDDFVSNLKIKPEKLY
ncbi:MAG: hypothetical protein L0H53_08635, partial [Candidatus Nitrosocosmicus sp.]|nr:hypothetical protein [Candidatus Nitrosocosmicus sp.]